MARTPVRALVVRLLSITLIAVITLIGSVGLTVKEASAATSNAPVVGIIRTWDGKGYWEVARDGGIFAFGNAGFYGSMGGQRLNQPIISLIANRTSTGYWEVASDGGIFAFGDAGFYGSMGGQRLNAPIVAITATPTGKGYWEVASDGGIFAFGDAGFYGSMGGQRLNAPVVAITATPTGKGYWEVASDGGIFAFGDAPFLGSIVVPAPALPSAQTLAQQILANSRIDKSGRLVLEDLSAAAAGRVGTAGAPLSATLLRLIVTLGQNHSFTISALESGHTGHSRNNSYHYTGDAVDFSLLDGQVVTGRNAPSLVIIREVSGLMPSGSGFGESRCGPTPLLPVGVGTFPDSCDHLHVQVTRNAP